MNTETRALRKCIIAFDDAAADRIGAVPGERAGSRSRKTCTTSVRLARRDIGGSLAAFRRSEKITGGKIKRLVRRIFIPPTLEERYPGLVVALRNLANRIL